MRTINSSTASSSPSLLCLPISLDRNKRPRVLSPKAGIVSRDPADTADTSIASVRTMRHGPTTPPASSSTLRFHQPASSDRSQDYDNRNIPSTKQQQTHSTSLLSTILEQFTCGPSTGTTVEEEPPVVAYEPNRSHYCGSTSAPSSCSTLRAPPMSPPVIYVRRYRQPDDRQYQDERHETPIPNEDAGPFELKKVHGLKKTQSFDTEITAATSHSEGSHEEESTTWLGLLSAKKLIPSLEDHQKLDGRVTPLVSNKSSSIMRRRSDNDGDDDYFSCLAGIGPIQQCVCFDDDDLLEAPHAESIMMDNRNRLQAMMDDEQR